MRKYFAAFLALGLFIGLAPSQGAKADSSSQFSISSIGLLPSANGGQVGYMIYGALSVQAGLPTIFTDQGICSQPDNACLAKASMISYSPGYFKMCSDKNPAPCVMTLESRPDEAAEWAKASFEREIDYSTPSSEGLGWSHQPSTGLPGSASGPLVFTLPGVKNAGGTETYVLDARYEISSAVSKGIAVTPTVGNLTLSIRPTVESTSTFSHTPERHAVRDPNGKVLGLTGEPGGNTERTYQVGNNFGLAKRFGNNETQFRLTVKLPKSTVGWFHGRVSRPEISIQDAGQNENIVTMTGSPIAVPISSTSLPYEVALAKNPKLINGWWPESIKQPIISGKTNGIDEWNAWSGFDTLFNAWLPEFDSKAKGDANLWMINTLPADQVSNPCFRTKNQLAGIITTNAMAYQAGPPAFSGGVLNYQVAGVHYDSAGNPFEGLYDLIIRSDVARCLYGFTNAPVSATVSVVDTKEGQVTAVTNFKEKDGWISFSAKGFGFSRKQINVKLSQESQGKAQSKVFSGWPIANKTPSPDFTRQVQQFSTQIRNNPIATCMAYFGNTLTKVKAVAHASYVCKLIKAAAPGMKTAVSAQKTPDRTKIGYVLVESH
ncbi:MAG: hypothetical protein KGL41_02155 [Actinomycetales bacterium]|nr:hypothetical protein [Actinomycetales bacterium]